MGSSQQEHENRCKAQDCEVDMVDRCIRSGKGESYDILRGCRHNDCLDLCHDGLPRVTGHVVDNLRLDGCIQYAHRLPPKAVVEEDRNHMLT